MLQKTTTRRPKSNIITFLDYFVTPSGRKLSFYLAGAGALGLAGINYLPHTLCVEYYRDFIQHYTFGVPTRVPDEIKQRIDRASDTLSISESNKKLIKSFTVTGFNVVEIGSLNSIFGGWIGVPSNFYYKSTEDIDKVNIFIRNERVKWASEHGKLLEESLILSESEQIFAFCRALLDLQSFKFYLNTITPSATFLGMYFAAQKINQTQNLYGRLFLVRYVVYTMLGLFGYGLCSFITDFVNFQQQREADETMANLGSDMIEAGVGYYKKIINRNIAIRELSGLDLYTAKGNENYFMRIREIPLTLRKEFFQTKLDELNKSEESPVKNSNEREEQTSSASDQNKKTN